MLSFVLSYVCLNWLHLDNLSTIQEPFSFESLKKLKKRVLNLSFTAFTKTNMVDRLKDELL